MLSTMYSTIFWTCAVVAAVVFGVMLYSIATFRAPPGATPGSTPATFRRCSLVEVTWALIPIAIVIAATMPSLRLMNASTVAIAEVSSTHSHLLPRSAGED
jgi:cytochrome c oxidase subunit II